MKKYFLFLAIAFAFASLNASELKANEIILADTATISFTETTHDYGTIKKGSDGLCVFTFKNTGNIPVVLSNVKASCGCTTPTWPREPILPGKSGEISVKYNTANIGGFQKSITINSNAAIVVLTIKGAVEE